MRQRLYPFEFRECSQHFAYVRITESLQAGEVECSLRRLVDHVCKRPSRRTGHAVRLVNESAPQLTQARRTALVSVSDSAVARAVRGVRGTTIAFERFHK